MKFTWAFYWILTENSCLPDRRNSANSTIVSDCILLQKGFVIKLDTKIAVFPPMNVRNRETVADVKMPLNVTGTFHQYLAIILPKYNLLLINYLI